jgi:hypothetical protein
MSSNPLARQKFEVSIGIEIDDITSIYEGGVPSSICVNSAASDEWRPLHKATQGRFHPVEFYNKHPNIGCAWAKLNSNYILARAIVYRDSPTAKWTEYGWPYHNDPIFGNLLRNWMEGQDIHPKGRFSNWTTDTFTIKGYDIPEFNRVFCPIPYMDNLDPVWCGYNPKTQEFIISSEHKDGMFIVDGSSHCGYVTSISPYMSKDTEGE